MDPRAALLAPLIVAALAALVMVQHEAHPVAAPTIDNASYSTAMGERPAAASTPTQSPASIDSVSKALKEVKQKATQYVEINADSQAARADARCEMRVDGWYGNNTHVCWHSICTVVTPEYRRVFSLVAAGLEASLDLLQAYNESTIAKGCVLVPGYPETVQRVAGSIRSLAKRPLTGCTIVEMMAEIKSLDEYIDAMMPVWMNLTQECLKSKGDLDDKQIEEVINYVKTAITRERAQLHDIVERAAEERTRVEDWLREMQNRLQRWDIEANATLERLQGCTESELHELGANANVLQEQLQKIIATLNSSIAEKNQETNAWMKPPVNTTRLNDALGRLQEELNKLSRQLQLNITVTPPGDKG